MIVCIFGEQSDLMPTYFAWNAQKRGIETIWLSESQLGHSWSFLFDDQDIDKGWIELNCRRLSFAQLTGAYVNLNPKPDIPFNIDLSPDESNFISHTRRYSLRSLIDTLPCTTANRLSSGRSNNSKPYQMRLLAKYGFHVPNWIVSNDPLAISEFSKRNLGKIIAKSCSGLRSRVKQIDTPLLEKLHYGTTPIIAQYYITGREVRVHTVGTQTFATEIISETIDYRFDEGDKTYCAVSIPHELELLCHKFAEDEQLIIAGFDFRVTNTGEWYCLEVNPVPTFMPYEVATGQQICSALIDTLVGK